MTTDAGCECPNAALLMAPVSVCRAAPATEPAMETAACLVEQFLPELAAPLVDCCGEVADIDELMRCIDALAADLGMQRAQPPEE